MYTIRTDEASIRQFFQDGELSDALLIQIRTQFGPSTLADQIDNQLIQASKFSEFDLALEAIGWLIFHGLIENPETDFSGVLVG